MARGDPSKSKIRSYFIKPFMMNKITFHTGAKGGDETMVPHKGKRAGPLRQFIPRKPHSTGVKLHMLADAVHPFVTDIVFVRRPKSEEIRGALGGGGR